MSQYTPIPKSAAPVLNAIENVANNRYAPASEIEKNARRLNKSIRTLEKKSKKWSRIMLLLAVGAVSIAAAVYGGPLPVALKTYGASAAKVIKGSPSAAAASLLNKGKFLASRIKNTLGKKYVAPLGRWNMAKKRVSNAGGWVAGKFGKKQPVPLGKWNLAKKRVSNTAGWAATSLGAQKNYYMDKWSGSKK